MSFDKYKYSLFQYCFLGLANNTCIKIEYNFIKYNIDII